MICQLETAYLDFDHLLKELKERGFQPVESTGDFFQVYQDKTLKFGSFKEGIVLHTDPVEFLLHLENHFQIKKINTVYGEIILDPEGFEFKCNRYFWSEVL